MSRPPSLLKLEQDAYYAVLRALAVNELEWTKEKLLTDLRKVLNITNDQHFKFLEEVMEDKLVLRLQESKNNNNSTQPPAAQPAYDMPPPPRQQPTKPGSAQRKPGRPPATTLKKQKSLSPPLGPRISRGFEPAVSNEHKRPRISKRDQDEGFDPKRSGLSHTKSFKASISHRGRGRGRRISGLTRDNLQVPAIQAVAQKYRHVPFEPARFQDRLANGALGELEDMHTALVLRDEAIQHHLDLIQQLEDDSQLQKDPAKYCQSLIQELEVAEERLSLEIELLRSDDDE